MDNGKMKDIIIEDIYNTDDATGVRTLARNITVWADMGLCEVIKEVEGVCNAYNFSHSPTEYTVYLDPRYNRDVIKKKIMEVLQ